MRHSPAALVGGSIVAFFVFIAIFAPFLAPYDPTRGNLADSYLPPGPEHWFGTNVQGQDVLSRIIFGARLTLGHRGHVGVDRRSRWAPCSAPWPASSAAGWTR